MTEVSKLFDSRSSKYDSIYRKSGSNRLMHQEKQVRSSIVEDFVFEHLLPKKQNVIIDVGCGTGRLLLKLRERGVNADLFGVDISPEMIAVANTQAEGLGQADIKFSTGRVTDVMTSGADMLLSLGVIGYQSDQEEFLGQLAGAVNKGGYLIFTTANGDSFLRKVRKALSKLHGALKGGIKSNGVEFLSMKHSSVESTLVGLGFKLQKNFYITYGLGLFVSRIECALDKWCYKIFGNKPIGKYFSLTVIYIYKKDE